MVVLRTPKFAQISEYEGDLLFENLLESAFVVAPYVGFKSYLK